MTAFVSHFKCKALKDKTERFVSLKELFKYFGIFPINYYMSQRGYDIIKER